MSRDVLVFVHPILRWFLSVPSENGNFGVSALRTRFRNLMDLVGAFFRMRMVFDLRNGGM